MQDNAHRCTWTWIRAKSSSMAKENWTITDNHWVIDANCLFGYLRRWARGVGVPCARRYIVAPRSCGQVHSSQNVNHKHLIRTSDTHSHIIIFRFSLEWLSTRTHSSFGHLLSLNQHADPQDSFCPECPRGLLFLFHLWYV